MPPPQPYFKAPCLVVVQVLQQWKPSGFQWQTQLGVPLQDRGAKSCWSGIPFQRLIELAELCMLCILLISWTLEDFLFSHSLVQASHLTFEAVLNVSFHKSQSSSTNLRQLFSVFDSLLTLFLPRLLLVILISLLMILSLLFNVKLRGSMRLYTVSVCDVGASAWCYTSLHLPFSFHCFPHVPVVPTAPPVTTIGLTYCPSDPVPSSLHQNMLPFMLVTPSNTLNLLCPLEFFPFGFKCPLAVPMLKKHLWTFRSFTMFLKPFSGISSVSIFTAFQD